jgi:DNA-binding transcriptional MerR regulator
LIKAAQRLGFTLGEIADLTDSKRPRRGTDGGLQDRAHAKLAQIEARIGELETVADLLRQAVTAGCEDLDVCAATPGCPLPFTPKSRTRLDPRTTSKPLESLQKLKIKSIRRELRESRCVHHSRKAWAAR